ncbi:MAG: hypothetical protein AMXMBFR53_08260 [Gemmatimonadota bacterium]
MDPRHDKRGFSLVELVMVLVLIGIMVNIVVPFLRPEKFRMDGAVILVGTTLTAQQRNAILRQHDVVVAVDTAQRRLRVHYDTNNDATIDTGENWFVVELGDGVVFGRGGAPARPLSSQVVSMTTLQDGLPALTFHRNGSASEESVIYLTAETAGSANTEEARAVEIERATGRVMCYSYASGEWERKC